MQELPHSQRISAVTCLDDPSRRALFDLVSRSGDPVSRDDAAAALEMSRSTASFHLDRLVKEGLLVTEFHKLGQKQGPGSGRPAKFYRPAVSEVSASIPDRHYELAGDLMAAAITESATSGEPASVVLQRLARAAGEKMGAEAGTIEAVLERNGFEPESDDAGGFVLGNCPFHRLARNHIDVVCSLNGALLEGAVAGCQDNRHEAIPDPEGVYCCARIVVNEPRKSAAAEPGDAGAAVT
ncbi:helix-turn-helix transcriptional regulator [Arthrobacter monumenti]